MFSKFDAWCPNRGFQPFHQYYTGFDWLTHEEIETRIPLDSLLGELNFQDVDDEGGFDHIQCESFCDWLDEGRASCELGQSMCHVCF